MDVLNLSVLMSPFGVVLVLLGIIGLFLGTRTLWARWLLLGGAIYAASLSKMIDHWTGNYGPPFVGPLELLVKNGRLLTLILLFALFITAMSTTKTNLTRLPKPVLWLLAVNLVVSLKIIVSGDIVFGVSQLAVVALVGFIMVGVGNWIQSQQDMDTCITVLAGVGALFVLVTCIQGLLDSSALFFLHGRLNSTAGNPQHAAALLGASAPAIFFMALNEKNLWRRILWLSVLAGACICVYFTGSRTGILMLILGAALVLRAAGFARVAPVAALSLGIAGVLFYTGLLETSDHLSARLVSPEDTRSHLWASMWNKFLTNPLFGVSMDSDRLGFGESSWLSVAAATGIVGLIPLYLFGLSILAMMLQLSGASAVIWWRLRAGVVVAGLASLLVGSLGEAYLLGMLSAPLYFTLIYLVLGYRLLYARAIAIRRLHSPLLQPGPIWSPPRHQHGAAPLPRRTAPTLRRMSPGR